MSYTNGLRYTNVLMPPPILWKALCFSPVRPSVRTFVRVPASGGFSHLLAVDFSTLQLKTFKVQNIKTIKIFFRLIKRLSKHYINHSQTLFTLAEISDL